MNLSLRMDKYTFSLQMLKILNCTLLLNAGIIKAMCGSKRHSACCPTKSLVPDNSEYYSHVLPMSVKLFK
jgi:hypothetical protein